MYIIAEIGSYFDSDKVRAKKLIVFATGTSTMSEINETIRAIRSLGNEDHILPQCITSYPSHFENVNIRAMKSMGEIFDVLTGYSEHPFVRQ